MKNIAKKAAVKRGQSKKAALKAVEATDCQIELQRMKKRAAQPEPKDTTSDEWRYWKIANLHLDFRSGNTDAYRRAHDEFRTLLTGLYNNEGFWRVSNALALLPHLIIARQEIEKMDEAKRAVLSIAAEEASEPEIDHLRIDHVFEVATYKDARRIANSETLQSREWGDEVVGDLLALMYGLTYQRDLTHREGILFEVVNAFMPVMDCARNGVETMVVRRFQTERKGALK